MGILCASRIINALNTKDSKAGVRHSYFTVSLDDNNKSKKKIRSGVCFMQHTHDVQSNGSSVKIECVRMIFSNCFKSSLV